MYWCPFFLWSPTVTRSEAIIATTLSKISRFVSFSARIVYARITVKTGASFYITLIIDKLKKVME